MLSAEIPAWLRWAFIAAAAAAFYFLGKLDGAMQAGQAHTDYVIAQATHAVAVSRAQQHVVVRTEIEYRDRIKTVYVRGEEIEKLVPVYVTRDDDRRFGVNAGFVRSYNAAWRGEPAGAADDADREPAGIPLSDVAEADAHNATACHAWREQALGWREFYAGLKAVMK
ncbi:hypothetical protein IP91_02568 [Pseudoduganella lurida]|uniref:Uncharacterized protein n=1 Tax=Pseudoduganella lurida TaxID=1036180 RepID=A0A562R7X5_9BURK|nr:hypothetical protein [Pseudoduganella lurida]TWI65161.1 hypothetical protein IP91_02568 [Pseudoduganella lurida]